jgi:hypothetical protein
LLRSAISGTSVKQFRTLCAALMNSVANQTRSVLSGTGNPG